MATRRNPRGSAARRTRNPGGSPAEPLHPPTPYDDEKVVSWGDERFNEDEADKEARRRSRQLPSPTQKRTRRPKA
jgi:hypothetical protein